MGAVAEYQTLEHVAMGARPYPSDKLEGCTSALALFAAAYLGHNDSVWFAEAGMSAVCVDRDADRLREMSKLYPDEWMFVPGDAWSFAERAYATGMTWDVVSVDCFTGDAELRCIDSIDLWCSLARRLVTMTITDGKVWHNPRGWRSSLHPRAPGVHWLVLVKA